MRRSSGERGADAGDTDEMYTNTLSGCTGDRLLRDYGNCPSGDGIGDKGAPVGLAARNRKEDESRLHLSAVCREPRASRGCR